MKKAEKAAAPSASSPGSAPAGKASAAPPARPATWSESVIERHGDLLYDLCQSVLWSQAAAPQAFRTIVRTLRRHDKKPRFEKYERAWILQTACKHLLRQSNRVPRRLTPAEQVMLDSNPDPQARLRNFDSYFHRLPTEAQILIILKDKYALPLEEIASALGIPAESARLQRQLALRDLEDWIWRGGDAML